MEGKQRSQDHERAPDAVMYHRGDCVDHPCPERGDPMSTHLRSRTVVVGGDPVHKRDLFEKAVPDYCECGAAVETDFRTVQWPSIPVTTDAALGLFERTDGCVALRVQPLSYPEEAVDWQAVVGVDDPVRDQEWDVGVVGGRLITRTKQSREPVWDATELTTDQLGVLLRKLPSEPKPIGETNLEATLEDYQAGHDIETGVPLP